MACSLFKKPPCNLEYTILCRRQAKMTKKLKLGDWIGLKCGPASVQSSFLQSQIRLNQVYRLSYGPQIQMASISCHQTEREREHEKGRTSEEKVNQRFESFPFKVDSTIKKKKSSVLACMCVTDGMWGLWVSIPGDKRQKTEVFLSIHLNLLTFTISIHFV